MQPGYRQHSKTNLFYSRNCKYISFRRKESSIYTLISIELIERYSQYQILSECEGLYNSMSEVEMVDGTKGQCPLDGYPSSGPGPNVDNQTPIAALNYRQYTHKWNIICYSYDVYPCMRIIFGNILYKRFYSLRLLVIIHLQLLIT